MQCSYIKALETLQMTLLAFVDRGVTELVQVKDEKYHARIPGERPHDGFKLDGPAVAGPTGTRDMQASGQRVAASLDHDDVDFPEFHLAGELEAVMSVPDSESSVSVASEADAKSEQSRRRRCRRSAVRKCRA